MYKIHIFGSRVHIIERRQRKEVKKSIFHVFLALFPFIPFLGTTYTAQASGFVDVPSRASKEVNYLAEGGIANGSSAATFASGKIVTRAEAAVFIGRALQLNGTQRETSFQDVGSGNFASGYIQSAVEKGILSGYDGNRFQPDGQVTLGGMAVMLSKAFGYSFGGTLSGAAKALMDQGIASRLEDGIFGSNNLITRVNFSVFLARAINPEFRTEASDSFSKELWTNTGDLNIRSGLNTSFASKGTLDANVQVAGAHTVGGWTYVKAGTKTGFVSAYYLRTTESALQNNSVVEGADSHLSDQTVIIDPGHGGTDPGASGFGYSEKTATLAVGLKVNSLFKNTPFKIAMTRS